MDKVHNKAFSNYLYERTNNLLKHLRENNPQYRGYLHEIAVLSRELEHIQHDSVQFKSIFTKYIELKDLVCDIENIYLFTKGLAEYDQFKEYVNTEDVITDMFFPE